MRLIYNQKTDTLSVRLRHVRIHHSEELDDGITVTIDSEGRVIGIDMERARKRLTLEELTNVSYENASVSLRNSTSLPLP